MKLEDAKVLTNLLIDETFTVNGQKVCARELGYRFKWMNLKRTLGRCSYVRKQILLSEEYVRENDEFLVEDTIRHELAHAFSYHIYGRKGLGHNRYWKHICVQVGANPQRCKSHEDGLKVNYKYIVRHKDTHEVFGGYHRLTKKTIDTMSRKYYPGRKKETLGKLEVVPA